ncbi:MAG: hypothetical protein NTZ83_04550 [Candidatus Pacearchaeota archaeon]|nr:hypothetical protein [Candidatus Pacearchaeota archaeon]
MEENCYCNSFDRKANSFSEFLKTFEIIASSKLKKVEEYGEVAYTVVLKCKKCRSYYLWDSYSQIYSEKDDLILARKYIPKTDEKGLKLILDTVEGIVDERDIDDHSQLSEKLFNTEVKRMLDATKN